MCGFAGQINLDVNRPVRRKDLELMAEAIRRRGPDAQGIWMDGPVGLAHRRLSIIDLSEAGNQPMPNEDGTVWVVYCGEIYNFPELREDLIALGHVFRSRADSETLVHLYEELGTDMLARLRGMYAFAIWDVRERQLFGARGRVGKKPFKYYLDDDKFLFASELKAILSHSEVSCDVDDHAIHQYLGFGYVFEPNTGFKQIRKLPPAHYLIFRDGRLTIHRYWQLDYRNQTRLSFQECKERIVSLLDEAVRIRLMSDVPLGAFLSGGIDSSAVVAMMSRHMSAPVRTFTIGFDYERHNELPYARTIAKRFSTDHTEHIVKANAAEVLPDLVKLYEEPYADSSALPSYYLAEVTKRSVTVALNGDGGDENFCGYERYSVFSRLQRMVGWTRRLKLSPALSIMRAIPGSFFGRFSRRAGALQELLRMRPEEAYGRHIFLLTDALKETLYTEEFRKWIRQNANASYMSRSFGREAAGPKRMNRLLLWDFENYLPEDLCVKIDLATMAHGLEARSPFLDHRMIEFCASIPPEWKYRRGQKKYILKKALDGILPREILYRRKQGFGIPIQEWFRRELVPLCRDTLLSPDGAIHQYVDRTALGRLLDSHISGASNEGYRLWTLLVLELWLRNVKTLNRNRPLDDGFHPSVSTSIPVSC